MIPVCGKFFKGIFGERKTEWERIRVREMGERA